MLVGSILGKYPTKACFKPANRDGKDGDFAIFDCQIQKNQHKRLIKNEIYFKNTGAYKKYGGIGDINEKVTFHAKIMPQSPGYITSYQVELAAK